MIRSMTGFGDARREHEGIGIRVEVRSVNNRYLKLSTRLSEPDVHIEQEVERIVRSRIGRGTVNVAVQLQRPATDSPATIDLTSLTDYWEQLKRWQGGTVREAPSGVVGHLLALPGVVRESSERPGPPSDDDSLTEAVLGAVTEAVAGLESFRETEGESMRKELDGLLATLQSELKTVTERAPTVAEEYRSKITARVNELLAHQDVEVGHSDLLREVSVFADRADITEELTRLSAHLEQFGQFLTDPDAGGRKLEFLGQEIYREVNTIGSKANDLTISQAVIEMKAAIEKIREILQNVE